MPLEAGERDRVHDELDVLDPLPCVGAQLLGHVLWRARQGHHRVFIVDAFSATRTVLEPNLDRDGSFDIERVAPDLPAYVVDEVAQR